MQPILLIRKVTSPTLLVSSEKIVQAQAKLNEIGIVFDLDPRRNSEYMDYIDVYSIIFNKVATGTETLTTAEFDLLETIALKNSSMASGLALATLKEYEDYFFIEPLIEPDYQGKSNKVRNYRAKSPNLNDIKVYPNPASEIVLAHVPAKYESVNVLIFDSKGQQVKGLNVTSGITTLSVKDLSSGSYIIKFQSRTDELIGNKLLIITR